MKGKQTYSWCATALPLMKILPPSALSCPVSLLLRPAVILFRSPVPPDKGSLPVPRIMGAWFRLDLGCVSLGYPPRPACCWVL